MRQVISYKEKYKKNIAVDLRKRGLSYSEIQKQLVVPRSTLSRWLSSVKLTQEQIDKLNEKRIKTLKENAVRKKEAVGSEIKRIIDSASRDIGAISKRELWLSGIVLYWRERYINNNISDIKNGVRLTTSDPFIARFFVKWLVEIGGISKKDIDFDFFITSDQADSLSKIIAYWSAATDFPKSHFNRYYVQKTASSQRDRKRSTRKKSNYGFLRIRVRASTMLARQIAGWIQGIKDTISAE